MLKLLTAISPVLFVACLCSCGYNKALQSAEPAGFIDWKRNNQASEVVPFQYVWVDLQSEARAHIPEQGFYKIYVAPVSTRFLKLEDKHSSLAEKAEYIASYLHDQLEKEIAETQGKYINALLVDTAKEADVVLELALTEIGLGSPVLYTVAWALPLPGTGTAVDSMHQPVIAFEARMTNAQTGEVIAEAADRKIPPIRILDLNKVVSKMAPLREICDNWSHEIGEAVQIDSNKQVVARSKAFSLLPW